MVSKIQYNKCSKILNTSCLPKRPRQPTQTPDQTASDGHFSDALTRVLSLSFADTVNSEIFARTLFSRKVLKDLFVRLKVCNKGRFTYIVYQ